MFTTEVADWITKPCSLLAKRRMEGMVFAWRNSLPLLFIMRELSES